jgi:hypothetical protein
MVWHSFILNPRNYLEDCVRFGLQRLWATGMPWSAVNDAIDANFNYNIPELGRNDFIAKTGHNWSNAEDPLVKKLSCPRCVKGQLEIPWTTVGKSEKPTISE